MKNLNNNLFLAIKNLSAEDKLLFICVRQKFLEEHQKSVLEIRKKNDLDWNYIYRTADIHGVTPLVYSNLKKCNLVRLNVPSEIVERFRKAYLSNFFYKNRIAEKITEILSFSNKENIKIMLIKGAALDISVYDNPWTTCSSDIDIIVEKRREELGERVKKKYHDMIDPGKYIECNFARHHDLDCDGMLPINYEEIWKKAIKVDFRGQKVFIMSPEDTLISLCINSARKRFFRLKSLCDIAEIIKKYNSINWSVVTSKAREYQCNNMVYTALLISRMTLGCQFPDEVLHNLRINPLKAKIISNLSNRMSFCSLSSLYSGMTVFNKQVSPSLILPYVTFSWHQAWRSIKVVYNM